MGCLVGGQDLNFYNLRELRVEGGIHYSAGKSLAPLKRIAAGRERGEIATKSVNVNEVSISTVLKYHANKFTVCVMCKICIV